MCLSLYHLSRNIPTQLRSKGSHRDPSQRTTWRMLDLAGLSAALEVVEVGLAVEVVVPVEVFVVVAGKVDRGV